MSKKQPMNMLNKMKNGKSIIILIVAIIIYMYFRSGINYLPVEDLNIPSGVGMDLVIDNSGNLEYSIPISYYNYHEENITSSIHDGRDTSIAGTRESRQLLVNKKMMLGLERVVIPSEEISRYSIRNLIDILFKNPVINDTALLAVCKGKSLDILSYNVSGYPSSADYIEGMIEHSKEFNFYSDNYKLIDVFVRLDAEGRNVVLPYIEIRDDNIEITGMALFKKDKMVEKIDVKKAKVMNMLREDKVRGVLTLQENSKESISYYAETKRKVRCEIKNNEFTFYIDLSLTGGIIENDLYHDIHENEETMKKFEKNMSEYVEKLCSDFIKEMQKSYQVDCLELGREAIAQHGRHTGLDWDEVVSASDINVSVKVKVDRMGRGDY